MTVRVRSTLSSAPAYRPGKPPAAAGGMKTFKLSSNEHHMPPLPAVVEAAVEGVQRPAAYADPGVFDLTEQMAGHLGVPTDHIVFGAGGSEILSALVAITAEPGTEVIYPAPSFEMYAQLTALSGAKAVAIGLTEDLRHDLPAMADAITDSTRLILLCSPNNPTGAPLLQDEFDAFMARVPSDLIVVLDQAYMEFITTAGTVDALASLERYPNLAIMRTFSKAHGLAGLRVGYGIAAPEIIDEMRKALAPFAVSEAAQLAASASLQLSADVDARAKEIASSRDHLIERLRDLGLTVPESDGNFVWLPLGDRSSEFEQACFAAGVAVRNLAQGVRVSIGPDEALDRIVEIAARFA